MFTLTIETGNAAFEDDAGSELARILRELARRLDQGGHGAGVGSVRDANGTTVGHWSYAPEEPADDFDPGPEVDDEGGMSEYRRVEL